MAVASTTTQVNGQQIERWLSWLQRRRIELRKAYTSYSQGGGGLLGLVVAPVTFFLDSGADQAYDRMCRDDIARELAKVNTFYKGLCQLKKDLNQAERENRPLFWSDELAWQGAYFNSQGV